MEEYLDKLLTEKKCPIFIDEYTLNNHMNMKDVTTWSEVEKTIKNYLSKYNDEGYIFDAKMTIVGMIDSGTFDRRIKIYSYKVPTFKLSAKFHCCQEGQEDQVE